MSPSVLEAGDAGWVWRSTCSQTLCCSPHACWEPQTTILLLPPDYRPYQPDPVGIKVCSLSGTGLKPAEQDTMLKSQQVASSALCPVQTSVTSSHEWGIQLAALFTKDATLARLFLRGCSELFAHHASSASPKFEGV